MSEVAPRVGAWIETMGCLNPIALPKSHLAWGRGLKRIRIRHTAIRIRSPLAWGRGLKHCTATKAGREVSRPSCGGVD